MSAARVAEGTDTKGQLEDVPSAYRIDRQPLGCVAIISDSSKVRSLFSSHYNTQNLGPFINPICTFPFVSMFCTFLKNYKIIFVVM